MRIEMNNINKTIKGVSLLTDINLALESGHIYGFVGDNGSGKTVLFKVWTILLTTERGSTDGVPPPIYKVSIFPESAPVGRVERISSARLTISAQTESAYLSNLAMSPFPGQAGTASE